MTVSTFNPVFYRTYSRQLASGKGREGFSEVVNRTQTGLAKLGKFTEDEAQLCREMMEQMVCLPSGRWLWVGGTPWVEKAENYPGAYNCCNVRVKDWDDLAYILELLSMGTGVGYVLEDNIEDFPTVTATFAQVDTVNQPGKYLFRQENTTLRYEPLNNTYTLAIGDSRQGWAQGVKYIGHLANTVNGPVNLKIDLGHVRKAGTPIKGFGGVANPVKLEWLYNGICNKLNQYTGRKLDSLGVAWILCSIGLLIVAGNTRRSAEIAQFGSKDPNAFAKLGLWTQDIEGNWIVDPDKDSLRMANFTRVYHSKPSYEEVLDAVRQQYHSGEGAIQYAPEAMARVAGLSGDSKQEFLDEVNESEERGRAWLLDHGFDTEMAEHVIHGYGLNPLTLAA